MTTKKQTEANQRNAQNSTGPRTTQGKAASSQNAVRHGLLAHNPVLATEDHDLYHEFHHHLTESLAPVGVHETMLVEEIVSLSWRLQRATTIETGLFTGGVAAIDARYHSVEARKLALTEIEQKHRFQALALGATDDIIDIIDEDSYERHSAAADAAEAVQRNDEVRLAQAFTDAASATDSVLKLTRYETALFRRRNELRRELAWLQKARAGIAANEPDAGTAIAETRRAPIAAADASN